MKNYENNRIFKKIALILTIIMVFNFVMPKFSCATNDDDGGVMFTPLSSFLRTVSDLIIQGVQKIFTGNGDIATSELQVDEVYETQKQSFITSVRNTTSYDGLLNLTITDNTGNSRQLREMESYEAKIKMYIDFEYNENGVLLDKNGGGHSSWSEFINDTDLVTDANIMGLFVIACAELQAETGWNAAEIGKTYSIKYGPAVIFSGELPVFDINFINPKETEAIVEEIDTEVVEPENVDSEDTEDGEESKVRLSSAAILRSVVSRWYQDLQKLALIGLLSVLVYVAIRMIISSTGEDKAKYKKMLMDWLVAMCIIFVLHYIMVFVLNITNSVNEVFKSTAIGENTEDVLMSNIRNEIGNEENRIQVFGNIIMYMTLVIFTVMFSIQYLKRVIYMAFLTIIAPLIALTYPLDKIKDGQAQAFSTWIKEYIFNALIQPIHLMLYVLLVGSATELISEYPLYGVVAIGFLIPAEKFFRDMFGFNKADSVSTLGSIAGGAAVMSMVKRIKGGKGKSSGEENSSDKKSTVRTVTVSPLEGLQNSSSVQQNASGNSSTTNLERETTGTNPTETNSSEINSIESRELGTSLPSENSQSIPSKKTQNKKDKRDIFMPKVKKGLRYAGNIAGGLAFGTIGLAAGVTSGDFEKSLGYMAGGGAAGVALGGRLGDGLGRGIDKIERAMERSEERHNKKMYEQLGYSEDAVKTCLAAGVTDPIRMKKILSSDIPLEEAIAYEHIAKNCDSSILKGDIKNFKNYLALRGIDRDEEGAEKIRLNVEKFL